MSSLYKRANVRQVRILRIVEGAVKNASHAHPEKQIDARMARGIAKRAAGTLTAAWPDVLALPLVASDSQGAEVAKPDGARAASSTKAGKRLPRLSLRDADPSDLSRRVGFRRGLHLRIGRWAGDARKAGNVERAEALADVLRLIAGMTP